MSAVFVARDLTVTYDDDGAPAICALDLAIRRGDLCALIGPNGSGKSTLIRALLGGIAPRRGEVHFEGRRIADWPRRELARRVGAVTQIEELPFPITVRELVAMGRYPHLGGLRPEGAADRHAIAGALERCDLAGLADRPVTTLSGGERQRARIARALAQAESTLVLDEPTVALDIGHEMAVFELLRGLTREGWTVVVATHHLNLAARYADALLLLDRGRAVVAGTAADVMRRPVLETVYGWPVAVQPHTGPGFDTGAPQVFPLSRTDGS